MRYSPQYVCYRFFDPESYPKLYSELKNLKGFPNQTTWGTEALRFTNITSAEGVVRLQMHGVTEYILGVILVDDDDSYPYRIGLVENCKIVTLI